MFSSCYLFYEALRLSLSSYCLEIVAVDRAQLHTTSIASAVEDDWIALADELGVAKREVEERTDESDPTKDKASLILPVSCGCHLATSNNLQKQ